MTSSRAGKKTPLLRCHSIVITIILPPRQARDKHREALKKRAAFSCSPSQSAATGDVALFFSTANDCWMDKCTYLHHADAAPALAVVDCEVFSSAKRALYIALRHRHLKVDILNEDDVVGGILQSRGYKALYIADPHVSSRATTVIAGWVGQQGGTLYATASAGLLGAESAYLLRCHFILKVIILPRQARDKHRESSQRERLRFPQMRETRPTTPCAHCCITAW